MIYLTLTKLPKFEPSAESDARSFLEASSLKPKTVSDLKVALEKTWGNFPQNKAVPSFRKRLIVRESWWKTFCVFAVTKKVLTNTS